MTSGLAEPAAPVHPVVPVRQQGPASELPVIRELAVNEFSHAEVVWRDYHETTGDPAVDRVFGVFVDKALVSLARCRRHDGGLEVDGIWTPPQHRGHGYSRMAVSALVEACHHDDLYMYAVRHLTGFYARFGFMPVAEKDLPASIRERYTWAAGNLDGAEVQPMIRKAGRGSIFALL